MQRRKLIDMPIPEATLGFMDGEELKLIDSRKVFLDETIVTIGVPGAFTPICTEQHIPNFIANARKLKKCGYSKLLCVAPNDPFVLSEWAFQLDPAGEILFLSDGNLDFVRKMGLTMTMPSLLLGERSERFIMVTQRGMIKHIKVEPDILTFSCTRAEKLIDSALGYWLV